jgi:uncharacterized protein
MEYIQRFSENQILQSIQANKVVLLFGARRVGKTILLKQIAEKLSLKILFLNGEDYDTQILLEKRSVTSYKELLSDIELLIIDEAQHLPEVGKILKLIVDEIPGIKVIASGSSSFDLLNKTGEPLVGRAFQFYMFPISQAELSTTENYLETVRNFHKRLIYGSYPEIIGIESKNEKEEYLKNIVSSYLFKDILSIEGIRNNVKMKQLVRLIAFQVGNEVSYEELGKQIGMSKNTVEKYLFLLSQCFIIFRLGSFSGNLRKEITKAGKWYFWDNGIRNAVISDLSPIELRKDVGALWENYFISERIKRNTYLNNKTESFFWRTYDRQEIDYVETHLKKIHAFEIKWSKSKAKIPAAFEKSYPDAIFQ